MRQIYNRFFWILGLLTNILLTSCEKNGSNPVPSVPVSISLNLDLPAYNTLKSPGGWVYVNGGSKGIVVYRNFDEFVAMDRHSTYDVECDSAIVSVDENNFLQLNDACSDSKYNMLDGTVIEGPAKWGLRRYNTTWDGTYSVYIYN